MNCWAGWRVWSPPASTSWAGPCSTLARERGIDLGTVADVKTFPAWACAAG